MSCFAKTIATINRIVASPRVYCSLFSSDCTVSRFNVNHLVDTEAYCAEKNIPIFYRLAVANRRIHNMDYANNFSVLNDEAARQTALDFFFGKVVDKSDRNWKQKFVYYTIFKYLQSKGNIRLADCFWKWRDATVDESGNIYYCATKSKCLGRLNAWNAKKVFHAKKNLRYRKRLTKKHCKNCIHYSFSPSIRGAFSFIFFFIHLLWFPNRYRFGRKV